MKNLIYIGNQANSASASPTTIDILAPLLRAEGFEIKTASSKKIKSFRLLEMLWVIAQNRKWAQYVMIDTYSTQNFYYAVVVAKLCRFLELPYLPLLHGGRLPERLTNSKKISEKLFEKALLNVAPSLYFKTLFQQHQIFNIEYIPNSIQLENYVFKARKHFQPTLLWVRSFAEIYDPLSAIKALEHILSNHPRAQLHMVGPKKDDSYEACIRYARLKSLPVSFHGFLSKQQWITLSATCDIFLNTATIDNMPVSVIEAMALGLPVISTNVGGLPFLISAGVDGLLVPPNDSARLAQAIEYVIDNPQEALERSLKARKKSEAFNWQEVKHQWTSIFKTHEI